MRIQIVNPNTSAQATARIGAAALAFASKGTEIVTRQSKAGPEAVEGFVDEAYGMPGLLAEIASGERDGVDGHVIASFDDTGLDAARSLAGAPVIGIGEAACFIACLVAGRFSVIAPLGASVPTLRRNVARYGFADRCAKVRSAEVPVAALDDQKSNGRERIAAEIERAKAEDGAEAIVLGYAGMTELAEALAREHGLPVVEGVAAAVRLAESLKVLGLTTSKLGGWAPPRPKGYLKGLGLAG